MLVKLSKKDYQSFLEFKVESLKKEIGRKLSHIATVCHLESFCSNTSYNGAGELFLEDFSELKRLRKAIKDCEEKLEELNV